MTENINIEQLINLTVDAGKLILQFYKQPLDIKHKHDNSPVTAADIAANDLITIGLKSLYPDIPVISEEADQHEVVNGEVFWLVDPLDGTKGFIRQDGEFTVNIALIKNNQPVLGVIYSPVNEECYFAHNNQAYKQDSKGNRTELMAPYVENNNYKIVLNRTSSKKVDEFVNKFQVQSTIRISSSIKFGIMAEGKGDIYPRFGRTMEWDTAAGHAILNAVGGRITDLAGNELVYGKDGYANESFIAYSYSK